MSMTTSTDVISGLKTQFERLGLADVLSVQPTQDFTVLEILDNQETTLVSLDTAIAWLERLESLDMSDKDIANETFEAAFYELTHIKGWDKLK